MKKNVIIITLLLITAYSMTFAYIKANDAERALKVSQEAHMEAEKQFERAMLQEELALSSAAEAKKQEQIALDLAAAFAKCQSK